MDNHPLHLRCAAVKYPRAADLLSLRLKSEMPTRVKSTGCLQSKGGRQYLAFQCATVTATGSTFIHPQKLS